MLDTAIERSTTPLDPYPSAVNINVQPQPFQFLQASFALPIHSGSHPFTHTRSRGRHTVKMVDEPVPRRLIVREHSEGNQSRQVLLVDSDYAALVSWTKRNAHVVTRASDPATARKRAEEILEWFPPVSIPDTAVAVDFWHTSNSGMTTTSRTIEAPQWGEVDHHYPPEVREELDVLMHAKLTQPAGRVILWHGPPGTGKTSAIRTLAQAWRERARIQVVLEPERVFSESSGLLQVLLGASDRGHDTWRVLVVEDADDLVRAHGRSSAVLSRLLNVGDGLVGQGLKVLVLLTTNEPPQRLHPALGRPGRCLSSVGFRSFTPAEAAASFPDLDPALRSEDRTLAEIMNGAPVDDTPSVNGTYL